jgi:hypothetical protein
MGKPKKETSAPVNFMKHILHLAAVIGLATAFSAFGQGQPGPGNPPPGGMPDDRVGRIVTPQPPGGNLDPVGVANTRPTRPERNAVSPQVQDKLNNFKDEADKYVRKQQELRKQLLGAATDAERERIREQLRTIRDNWLEQARTVREESRDRLPALMEQLPNRRQMLRDEAKERANDIKAAAQETVKDHKRRGE